MQNANHAGIIQKKRGSTGKTVAPLDRSTKKAYGIENKRSAFGGRLAAATVEAA
jgi:hypothetical protein